MKYAMCLSVLLVLLPSSLAAASDDSSVAEIKSVIEKSYVHGAFNGLDPEAMKRGFHPDFAIFSPNGEDIRKYPIAEWTERTAKKKADPEFKASENSWQHEFASIDVTGNSASVKLELSQDGTLIYTDYLSLLKFDSGWRVVAKVYHHHKD